MIKKNDKEIVGVFKGTTEISAVYKGLVLVYQNAKTLIVEGIPPLTLLKALDKALLGYRVYGNSIQQILPDGYTQLEYIETDGNAYINTGFSCTKNSGLKIKYRYTASGSAAISGVYTSGTADQRTDALFVSSNSGMTSGTNENVFSTTNGYISSLVSNVALNLNTDYETLCNYYNSGDIYCNNTLMRNAGSKTPNPSSIYLFARYNASADNIAVSHSRIYYAIFTEGTNISKHFIPAKRNSDNVLGMYDIINNEFKTNVSTGSFTAGPTAPTPNAPIEIESVGDKTKNLWNSTLIAGCMKFADGQYLNYPGYVCNATPISVEAGETYTLSADNYDDPERWSTGFVFYNNGTFVSSLTTASLTVTIPSGVNQLYYDFRKQSSPGSLSPSDITNVQLEKGSSATSYEPYGYNIPITVGGKNICNPNSFINTGKLLGGINGGLNTNTNYKTTDYIFIKSGTYTLSLDNTYDGTGNTTTRMCLYNTNYGYTGNTVNDTSARPTHPIYTFTIANDCYYRLSVRNTDTNVQLEKSGTETTYEPYVAPRTTNIYLNEPLRKIGDYTDYIDFETQKVYRNVKKINLSTTLTNFSFSTSWDNDDYTTCYFYTADKVITFYPISNYFKTLKSYNAGVHDNAISSNTANNYIYIKIAKAIATSKTELNNWLNTLSTPVEIIYQLASTTEKSIELPDILLNKGTNVVDVETSITPSNLWIKYKGKE